MALGSNLMWLIGLLCAIWVIYDVVAKQKSMKTMEKVIWIVCAFLFNIVTAIVYYFMKKR